MKNDKTEQQQPAADKKDDLSEALSKAHFTDDIHKGPDDPAFLKNNLPDPGEKDDEPQSASDSGE